MIGEGSARVCRACTSTGSPFDLVLVLAIRAQREAGSGGLDRVRADFIPEWGPQGTRTTQRTRRRAGPFHRPPIAACSGTPEPADPRTTASRHGLTKTGSAGARTGRPLSGVRPRGHFAWGQGRPARAREGALKQLMMYALPLENPPLLVVSDRLRIEIHTHFTGTPSERSTPLRWTDIAAPSAAAPARAVDRPDAWRPGAATATSPRIRARTCRHRCGCARPAYRRQVSHFLTQCLFCFFAEDVGLLPARLFERLAGVNVDAEADARAARPAVRGDARRRPVRRGRGALVQRRAVPRSRCRSPAGDVAALKASSALDWSAIDPPSSARCSNAGSTRPSAASSARTTPTRPPSGGLVEPVVQRRCWPKWATHKEHLVCRRLRSPGAGSTATRPGATRRPPSSVSRTAEGLPRARPGLVAAATSVPGARRPEGHRAPGQNLEAEALGLERQHDVTGPHNVLGIELNEYAAELARVTVWIGELQWRIQRGYGFKDAGQCWSRWTTSSAATRCWPPGVGRGPADGGATRRSWATKKMRSHLGDAYRGALRAPTKGACRAAPTGVLLVRKARAQIERGRCSAPGWWRPTDPRRRKPRGADASRLPRASS